MKCTRALTPQNNLSKVESSFNKYFLVNKDKSEVSSMKASKPKDKLRYTLYGFMEVFHRSQ